jgi:hypothetical protein
MPPQTKKRRTLPDPAPPEETLEDKCPAAPQLPVKSRGQEGRISNPWGPLGLRRTEYAPPNLGTSLLFAGKPSDTDSDRVPSGPSTPSSGSATE